MPVPVCLFRGHGRILGRLMARGGAVAGLAPRTHFRNSRLSGDANDSQFSMQEIDALAPVAVPPLG